LVFVGTVAILCMTSIGLESLGRGGVSRRWWFLLPMAVLAILGAICLNFAINLPAGVANSPEWATKMWFRRSYSVSGFLCGLGVAGWLLLWTQRRLRPWFIPALAVMLMGDLLWFAHDRSAQEDPNYYFPRIPILEKIANSTNDRILGF